MTTPPQRIFYEAPIAFMSDPVTLRQFFLYPGMSVEEMLNALVRLSLYFALAVCVVRRQLAGALLVPLLVALASMAVYQTVSAQRRSRRRTMEDLNVDQSFSGGKVGLCRRPSPQNPFMNVMVTDIASDPQRPRACDLSDPRIRKSADRLHSRGQARADGDIFNRSNSRRQFYAMPNTEIPNDQTGFAEWRFGCEGPTAKERHASWVRGADCAGA
jgi:hypothetical protein